MRDEFPELEECLNATHVTSEYFAKKIPKEIDSLRKEI